MLSEKTKDIVRSHYPDNERLMKLMASCKVRNKFCQFLETVQLDYYDDRVDRKRDFVEAVLAGKDAKSLVWKIEAIQRYIEASPRYSFLDGSQKQAIAIDMAFSWIAQGFLPEEYACYGFEFKSMREQEYFISDGKQHACMWQMNNLHDVHIFKNKWKTYCRYETLYARDAVLIKDNRDYQLYLDFVNKHSIFVAKALYEAGGKGISLVEVGYDEGKRQSEFKGLLKRSPILLEEKVVQSATMSAINPTSVNTVRVMTFNTREGILIAFTFLKCGRNGSFVDNGGSGGILVGVDANTGILSTDGVAEDSMRFAMHPDTGLVFKGYQLPDWAGAIELCKHAAMIVPDVRFVGWDIAHTESGWIVIEGNSESQMIGPQMTSGSGCKKELYKIMRKMELFA